MAVRIALQLRLPQELKLWLEREALHNGSSQNSEVIRALRYFREHIAVGHVEVATLNTTSSLRAQLGGHP